jgi:hypothetical protein
MKLDSGKIVLYKPLERVYAFLTKLENLKKQTPKGAIRGYEVEFDDELSGEIEVGTVVAIYLFAVYEGEEDRCCEFKVVGKEKNKNIKLEMVYVGKYDEEKDDWSEPIPIDSYFGVLGIELVFSPCKGNTLVTVSTTLRPKSKLLEVVFRIFNFLGRMSSYKYYREWAKLVESYA